MAEEERLWSYLDAHGLPFRDPLGDLIKRFGTTEVAWSKRLRHLHLPASRPLLGGLIPGFTVTVTDRSDPEVPPDLLTAGYRAGGWTRAHSESCAAITAAFGPGKDVSVSNTRAMEWAFGRARLRATVWPPEANRHMTNSRHAVDPGAAEECSLSLQPRWVPPLSVQALGWLRSYAPQPLVPQFHPLQQGGLRDWPDNAGPIRPGIGLTPDGAAVVIADAGGLCLILPRARLLSIDHDGKTPARGPGGAEVSVRWQGGAGEKTLRIWGNGRDHAAVLPEATALSDALDLPLCARVWPDD